MTAPTLNERERRETITVKAWSITEGIAEPQQTEQKTS